MLFERSFHDERTAVDRPDVVDGEMLLSNKYLEGFIVAAYCWGRTLLSCDVAFIYLMRSTALSIDMRC